MYLGGCTGQAGQTLSGYCLAGLAPVYLGTAWPALLVLGLAWSGLTGHGSNLAGLNLPDSWSGQTLPTPGPSGLLARPDTLKWKYYLKQEIRQKRGIRQKH